MSDPDAATPPAGQLSFSGIPEAQFVEDVDSHMLAEENAEEKLKARIMEGKSDFQSYTIV
jgi:hypothetical protein